MRVTLNKSEPQPPSTAAKPPIVRRAASRRNNSWELAWAHLRRNAARITAGGYWTDELPRGIRSNLRWFWFDGVFAQASEVILTNYLSLFVLALGATAAQIGLISALSNLSAAALLLPGAALVERWGHRKHLVVFSGGGMARLIILMLALLPLGFSGPAAIAIAIGLAVIRSAFSNLSLPAWVSLTADIVPLQWRGRYLSARNMAMTMIGMVILYPAGLLITRIGGLAGYQVVLGLAFAIGLISTFSFSRLEEAPASVRPASSRSPQESVWQILREHPNFLAFSATAAVWNFSLNIGGPFFSPYLVEGLKADAGTVGALNVITSLTALVGLRLFGRLVDRWNPRRVQLICGLLIPVLPVAWLLVRSPWHVVPINLASGFLWAGYDLASFNFLLRLIPEGHRERYSAVYQIIVTVALAGGAALGGLVATRFGYMAIFVLSGVGRLTAALLFARLVRQY
jgi:MFS family permease